MNSSNTILTATAAEAALVNRIAVQEQQVASALAPYDPLSATYTWLDTLRAIEELINLITVDWEDDAFEQNLFTLPLGQLQQVPHRLITVRERLTTRFGENFSNRFTRLVIQGASIAVAFASHGFMEVTAGFQTVGTMVGYLQSRRRHFVGLLHMLPNACRGQQVIGALDTLNIYLPMIELSAVQMMGAQNALLVKLARSRLKLPATTDHGAKRFSQNLSLWPRKRCAAKLLMIYG